MSNDSREIADLLKEGKWKIHRHTGDHAQYRCSCEDRHEGDQVSVPTSASDHRAIKNLTADLRKCPETKRIFDAKKQRQKGKTTNDDKVRHADIEREDVTTPVTYESLQTPEPVVPEKAPDGWKLAGITDMIEARSRARWPKVAFTTNMLVEDLGIQAFFEERGITGRKEMRDELQRSMRGAFSRGLRQTHTGRSGTSEYTWVPEGEDADDVERPRPEKVDWHELAAERRAEKANWREVATEVRKVRADGHTDVSALQPGDKLEVVALVGENFLVRDEVGQLYGLRPVRLEVQ